MAQKRRLTFKIVSGGQTGVDQAALRAAAALGLETGGTMPKGWLTEDGDKPEFATLYGMDEAIIPGYPYRTRKNVAVADATLWYGPIGSRGYFSTLGATIDCKKPFHVLSMTCEEAIIDIARVLIDDILVNQGMTLNVAGSRESVAPRIGEFAERELTDLFRRVLREVG